MFRNFFPALIGSFCSTEKCDGEEDFSNRMFSEDNSLAMQTCELDFSPDPETYGPQTRHFQGIPSIAVAGGRLWATWFSGDFGENFENYVLLVTSDDHGKSWSEVKLVIDPPGKVRACDSTLWFSPDGELFLYWSQIYGWYDGRSGVWQISTKNPEDANPNWSKPKRLCDGVMVNKPIVCDNGNWAYPVCQWLPDVGLRAKRNPEVSMDMYKSHIYISDDKGSSLRYQGSVDIPNKIRSHDENILVEPGDGSLCMLVRTKNGIMRSSSEDHGKTWSAAESADIPAPVARFSVTKLRSGRLLLLKNGDMGKPIEPDDRAKMVAFLSDDQGNTWPHSLCLDERPDVSYPNVDQDEMGRIFVIYDRRRYHEKEILMANITEEDIMAGKIVSDDSGLELVMDKASGGPATVSIYPDGGSYDNPLDVEIDYPIFGPSTYYTTDGSEPNLESFKYTRKILVDKTMEVKARSIGGINGQTKSPIAAAKFVIKTD